MAKNTKDTVSASKGNVTQSSAGRVEVDSAQAHRNLPIIAPYGIVYVPPVGAEAVVTPLDLGQGFVGVLAPCREELQSGELMLYSSGGASIVLKNNGSVLINGKEYGGAD
ncbi:MAG: hypothetical protein ACI4GZ_03155 [Ruminococcus sp.]